MTREDNLFDLNLSYYLELSYGRAAGRIDYAITAGLLISSCSAFAWLAGVKFFAAMIAILTVIQLVYQFGKRSGLALEQAKRYQRLILSASRMDDEELHQQRLKLEESDSDAWSVLHSAAYKRACCVLGLSDQTPSLNKMEWWFAFIGGNLPKIGKVNEQQT